MSLSLGTEAKPEVIIQTGNIFGNAARDATGLLDVNIFANSRDFNDIASEINRRIDTLPHDHDHPNDSLRVTCNTCHRGVNRPLPLEQLIQQTAQTSGADSAARAYRTLRERYYGRAAYDFGEPTLNIAAFRLARAGEQPSLWSRTIDRPGGRFWGGAILAAIGTGLSIVAVWRRRRRPATTRGS